MNLREVNRSKDQVRSVFDKYSAGLDQNDACQPVETKGYQSRYLGMDEVRCAMEDLKVVCGDVRQVFDEMDKNKDGKVDFEEFFDVATKPRGVECWASKLTLWRSLGDGLLYFTGEAEDSLQRIAELEDGEISAICDAMVEKMRRLLTQEVLKVKESVAAMNAKLAQDEAKKGGAKFHTFEANMGSIEDFRKGLGTRVGHPHPKLEEAMKIEHTVKLGCDVEFETRNYGIRTTARKEWEFLMVDASQCPERDRLHGRRVRMLQEVLEDEEVEAIVKLATLLNAEVEATVLYTGPLYEVYNSCLRQLQADHIYQKLSNAKNLFPTTIFLLASAVLKISRVMKLGEGLKVYRGLGGQMKIPEKMVREDEYGRRGAAEWGFMSTSSNKSIALSYSGVREGKPAASVFVAEVSAIDRGACIRAFSQYPQEIEFLYPPLSFIELSGEEYFEVTEEGPVRMIPVRISVNQKTMLSEEVVGQKKELHLRAFENLLEEARRDLMAKEASFGSRFQRDPCSTHQATKGYQWSSFVEKILEECCNVFKRHQEKVKAEEYNEDVRYEGLVREMLRTMGMAMTKARLYLEDVTKTIEFVLEENLRSCHRLWTARLRRMVSEDGDENRRKGAALELCKVKGLVMRSVEEENETGESRMLEAARDGWRGEDVDLLCIIGGDVNGRDQTGKFLTPVIEAAKYGHKETLMKLIEKGGDVDAVDGRGRDAFFCAVEEGHAEVVKVLLDRGCNVNVKDTWKLTPLMYASLGGNVEVVKALLEKGADANADDNKGFTALMYAADRGRVEAVKVLLENGGDVNLTNHINATALMYAVAEQSLETVRTLLEKGSDVNAVQQAGWTALMFAADHGNEEIAKVLLDHGASLGGVNQDGRSARDLAVEKGHGAVAALLAC